MANLVLELRQGDLMVVNGAVIRFRNKARIELTAHARFLFGKQLMSPQDATTLARRIYYALQTTYIGNEDERPAGLVAARELIATIKTQALPDSVNEKLDRALAAAEAGNCYQALKLCRDIIRLEEASERAIAAAATATAEAGSAPVEG